MPRDGTENLIPVTERTKKEAREISRKGGIASGKARRGKADLKKKINQNLEMDVFSPQLKKMLEEKGLSATNQTAIIQTGWVKYYVKCYYLDAQNGEMKSDCFVKYNNGWYLLLPDGDWLSRKNLQSNLTV